MPKFRDKRDKMKNHVQLILLFVFSVLLAAFFPEKIYIVLVLQLVGLLPLWASVLGKYIQYPSEINLISGFFIGLSVAITPLLLVIIPLFYSKAKNNLHPILK